MSTDSKLHTSEKIFSKDLNKLNAKKEDILDEDDVSTIFKDLHVSVLTKAVSISPDVKSVTLGVNSKPDDEEKAHNSDERKDKNIPSYIIPSSTPEKRSPNISSFAKVKQKLDNLSPIEIKERPNVENTFSSQKLISELDAQRRLTVDKVMRERIQNMYETNKLMKESLEQLKRIRQEAAIARRSQLERKILDEIHKQEVLNKPKREAQWAKDNLKEAQRIQERNQRVKEAEEEAKKKSRAILLKRLQILELQKEYNQEYEQMLEKIKLCKEKTSLPEFASTQLKMLKILEELLNIFKQITMTEDAILTEINEQEILNRPKSEALKIQEETRKKSEAILAKRKQSEKILSDLQKKYNHEYKQTLETIRLCKDETVLNEFTATQSKMLDIFEGLLTKFKQCDVTEEVVSRAKKLIENLKLFRESLVKEVTKINEAVTETAKKEESLNKAQAEQTVGEQNISESSQSAAVQSSSNADLSDCFDSRSLELYLNLKNLLENHEKTIQPLLTDDSLKKFRFSCQKAVNIPVNAISPVSGPHLSDKYLKLHSLLSGKTVEVGEIKITASQHPLGVSYCKYLLAKKFVRQGDLTVSSKPDAAFSIAAVLASLWIDFPDFGQLVLAHFQSACPYLAPVFMPQVEGQSDEDYHKSLGYHYSQNGEVEKQDSFLKRMSGIMRLYSALLIANVRQPGKMNPLGLSEGWRWISALLNLEPRPDICATLLYDFLEVAGNEMFRAYGGQFRKMLAYICQEYFPKLEKVTPSSAGGPMVRLEGFLQKILKEESIPPPQGILPPNFW